MRKVYAFDQGFWIRQHVTITGASKSNGPGPSNDVRRSFRGRGQGCAGGAKPHYFLYNLDC
jgi:hypothetical protein